jgi:4-hydroxy-3-methylbut-2-en-1-yl diphosphate reductase
LFEHCKTQNPNTYFVSEAVEVESLDIDFTKTIGICGATSTPRWAMEAVQNKLIELAAKQGIR